MTLNQIRNDHRIDDVNVDPDNEYKYTIYIDSEYLAGDDTSTIVAQTIKEVTAQIKDIKLANTSHLAAWRRVFS
tara:strand:- start:1579 stop:1800 length:222 start_codon:yes stop_codon:yes gene_type:complete